MAIDVDTKECLAVWLEGRGSFKAYVLKKSSTAKTKLISNIWMDGWFVYYNFLRFHSSMKGKTPAEACGIDLEIENGWEEMIREATLLPNWQSLSSSVEANVR